MSEKNRLDITTVKSIDSDTRFTYSSNIKVKDRLKKINISGNWEWIAFAAILTWFIVQSLYFAKNINLGVSPDEIHHLGLIQEFSKTMLVPGNGESTFAFGAIESRPWLYYWIMARLSSLRLGFVEEVFWLRLMNTLFSGATVFFTFLTSKLLLKSKLAQTIALAMLSNTLMFVFLSGSINYDNLVNLCAIILVYLLLIIIKKYETRYFLLYLVMAAFSIMVKTALWPYVLVTTIILSIYLWQERREMTKDFVKFLRPTGVPSTFLALVLIVLTGINAYYFGNNIVKFHSINPSCSKVLTHEQCMNYSVYSRNDGFLNTLDERKTISFYSYLTSWIELLPPRIYGIMGHRNMLRTQDQLVPYYVVFAASILLFIRKYKISDSLTNILLATIFFYSSFLLVYFNYIMVYKKYLVVALAVQGRYLFPVIGLIYILMCKYLFTMRGKAWRMFISISILLIFVSGCFPFFQRNVTAKWLGKYDVVDLGLRVNKNDHIPNGITESNQFTQTFYSDRQNLMGIEIFVSTFGEKDVDDYTFTLYEEGCEVVLEEVLIDGGSEFAVDNSYHSILFPEQVDSLGRKYCFTLSPESEVVDKPITLQLSDLDVYDGGDLFLSEKYLGKDIVFNLIYKR